MDRKSLWEALGTIQDGLLNSTPIQCHFKIINIKLQPTTVFPGNVAIIFAEERSRLGFVDSDDFRTILDNLEHFWSKPGSAVTLIGARVHPRGFPQLKTGSVSL